MAKMQKKLQFSRFDMGISAKAWRISCPHISTSENLHAKRKPVFSAYLRAFEPVFSELANFGNLAPKKFGEKILAVKLLGL
jgi:hypothetical protein